MAISRDEVLHVARLARLALTDEGVERLQQQLSAILEAVGKVHNGGNQVSPVGPLLLVGARQTIVRLSPG